TGSAARARGLKRRELGGGPRVDVRFECNRWECTEGLFFGEDIMFKTRGVWLAVAAGALLGWVAAIGQFCLVSPAQAADAKKRSIEFVVRLPADASLEIDGNKTTETGAARTFITPALPVEGHYSYTLKATLQGKEVTRTIHLAHGLDNTFDLRAEF